MSTAQNVTKSNAITAKYDAKLKKIRQARSKALSKANAGVRELRTKQSIIVGAWLLKHDRAASEDVVSRLTRSQDIEAFEDGILSDTPSAKSINVGTPNEVPASPPETVQPIDIPIDHVKNHIDQAAENQTPHAVDQAYNLQR